MAAGGRRRGDCGSLVVATPVIGSLMAAGAARAEVEARWRGEGRTKKEEEKGTDEGGTG